MNLPFYQMNPKRAYIRNMGVVIKQTPLAKRWFMYTRTKPLCWMREDMTDMLYEWCDYVGTIPPKWLCSDRNCVIKCFIRKLTFIDLPIDLVTSGDPSWQDENGNTLAMYWIMNRFTKPPKCLAHDPFIENCNVRTCADLWYRFNQCFDHDSFEYLHRGRCPK